jgi:hypothetical protein
MDWIVGVPGAVRAFFAGIGAENYLLENLSYLATVIGLPVLFSSYIFALNAESERREYGTYDLLESKYVEFQQLALRYAKLDVAEFPLKAPPALDDQEIVQQRILYMILFSLFEPAFLMYRSRFHLLRGRTRNDQWKGWESYMRKYAQRESCRLAWFNHEPPQKNVRQDFDDRFEHFMHELMQGKGA